MMCSSELFHLLSIAEIRSGKIAVIDSVGCCYLNVFSFLTGSFIPRMWEMF